MEQTADNAAAPSASPGAESLAHHPLVESATQLAERHATGVLRLGERGDIWFADGLVILAASRNSLDLAQVLVDAELGDEQELRELISGRRQGDELGAEQPLERLLDHHPQVHNRLRRLLHEYTLNALFEMLVPGDMTPEFDDGLVHPLGPRFAEHALELLAKAAARMDLWRRIAARIPSTTAAFTWSRCLPDQLESRLVTNDEWRYLALLNGTSSVAEVINETGDSAFRVCSALYRLLLEGLIEECPTGA